MKQSFMLRIIALIVLATVEGSYSIGQLAVSVKASIGFCIAIGGLIAYTLIKYYRISNSQSGKIVMLFFFVASIAYGTFAIWLHNPHLAGASFGIQPHPQAAAGMTALTALVFAFTAMFAENKNLPSKAGANQASSAKAIA